MVFAATGALIEHVARCGIAFDGQAAAVVPANLSPEVTGQDVLAEDSSHVGGKQAPLACSAGTPFRRRIEFWNECDRS